MKFSHYLHRQVLFGLLICSVGLVFMGCPNVIEAPLPSTIIFADGTAVSRAVSDGSYTNAVSGDGGGTLSYSSASPTTATVDPSTGTVSFVAVGTTVITAQKAASGTHAAVSNSYALTLTAVVPAVPGSNSPLTIGRTLSLTASAIAGATYAWTGPNGFSSSSQNPSRSNMQASDAGNYSVVTTLNGFSSSPQSVTVSVNVPTGGTVTQSGASFIHTFTGNGTFVTALPLTIDALVVAGGGSGGHHTTTNGNGGGGGGGVLYATSFSLPAGTYAVTVGNGGASVPQTTAAAGTNGQNSVFASFTAIGGGGGGSTSGVAGKTGGSGGGGAGTVSGVGSANQPSGYANAGGTGSTWTGGGGGGAGSAGVNGDAATFGGNGGAGYACSISGSIKNYAGGGGGGANSSERGGDGFDGGGRGFGNTTYYAYTSYPVGINATTRGSSTPNAIPNTGGGGGGGSYWSPNGNWFTGSGSGGSGIVIIRY